jgi:hypothetical protein
MAPSRLLAALHADLPVSRKSPRRRNRLNLEEESEERLEFWVNLDGKNRVLGPQ